MSVRRSRRSKLRTKIVTGGTGPALVEVSIRLHLDGGGHVSTGTVNIPESVKTPERAFRAAVADQLHQLADQIATAHADNLLDPLAWPLVQFDPPACDEESAKTAHSGARSRRLTLPARSVVDGRNSMRSRNAARS